MQAAGVSEYLDESLSALQIRTSHQSDVRRIEEPKDPQEVARLREKTLEEIMA
jgi:hypothetical protein